MMAIKANGIPLWVTIIAIVLGLYCMATGMMGLADASSVTDFVAGADNLAVSWGGRMAGTGIVLVLAVLMRNAHVYTVAFAAAIFRELGDLIAALSGTAEGFPAAVVIIVLLIDMAALVVSLQATRKAS